MRRTTEVEMRCWFDWLGLMQGDTSFAWKLAVYFAHFDEVALGGDFSGNFWMLKEKVKGRERLDGSSERVRRAASVQFGCVSVSVNEWLNEWMRVMRFASDWFDTIVSQPAESPSSHLQSSLPLYSSSQASQESVFPSSVCSQKTVFFHPILHMHSNCTTQCSRAHSIVIHQVSLWRSIF